MVAQIRLEKPGDAETMKVVHSVQIDPGPGEVWVKHDAVGVNYLDVMQRSGTVPIPMPSGLGLEGAGRATSVGPEVDRSR